nr:hypothetical protein [Tanacetum cinerariifolium]
MDKGLAGHPTPRSIKNHLSTLREVSRPIEFEGLSSWDLDKTTWGGRVEAIGTVPGVGLVLAGKTGTGYYLGGWKFRFLASLVLGV